MLLLAVGHRACVGKDTAANYLVQKYGFKKRAFADPVKQAAKAIFGLTDAQLYDQKEKETVDPFWGVTPRVILQKMGTECMRHGFSSDIWIKAAKKYIFSEENKKYNWVFSDARFLNEIESIKSWGGFVIKLNRPGYADKTENAGIAQHPSEVELDNFCEWDYVITNDGYLAELYQKLDEIIKPLLKLS